MLFTKLTNVSVDSNLCLSYGEIDCRFQILRQAEKGDVSVDNVIEEVVKRFLQTYEDLENMGFKNLYTMDVSCGKKGWEVKSGPFPTYGTYEERLEVTRQFNRHLKRESFLMGFRHIEYLEKIFEKTETNEKYLDSIHLKSEFLVPIVIDELSKFGVDLRDK